MPWTDEVCQQSITRTDNSSFYFITFRPNYKAFSDKIARETRSQETDEETPANHEEYNGYRQQVLRQNSEKQTIDPLGNDDSN